MNGFMKDVLSQPSDIRRAMEAYRAGANSAVLQQISAMQYRDVLFTGMGSSHFCGQAAVIHLAKNGIRAQLDSASEILHYEMERITPDTLLVLISQSGESGEIVELIERLPADRCVVGITNDPESTLAKRANLLLLMHVASEEAVSTRTYLASLVLCALVATALTNGGMEAALQEAELALKGLEQSLCVLGERELEIRRFVGIPPYLCVIGRGYARATARAGALFIRECAKYPALDFDSGEFRHGPFEMVDAQFCALLFAPGDATYPLHKALAADIARLGGKLIFVTEQAVDFAHENILTLQLPLSGGMFGPLVDVSAAQIVANLLAEQRGLPVGVFRQSNKVTGQ